MNCPAPIIPNSLTVRWVDGEANLKVFDFEPGLGIWTPTEYADGRADILTSPDTSLTIAYLNGSEVLRIEGGIVKVGGLRALGGTASGESPRLEFWLNASRVASLHGGGVLTVPDVTENPAPPAGDQQFEFYANGNRIAILTRLGLVARGLAEQAL